VAVVSCRLAQLTQPTRPHRAPGQRVLSRASAVHAPSCWAWTQEAGGGSRCLPSVESPIQVLPPPRYCCECGLVPALAVQEESCCLLSHSRLCGIDALAMAATGRSLHMWLGAGNCPAPVCLPHCCPAADMGPDTRHPAAPTRSEPLEAIRPPASSCHRRHCRRHCCALGNRCTASASSRRPGHLPARTPVPCWSCSSPAPAVQTASH
jgi:hypothetical protein